MMFIRYVMRLVRYLMIVNDGCLELAGGPVKVHKCKNFYFQNRSTTNVGC